MEKSTVKNNIRKKEDKMEQISEISGTEKQKPFVYENGKFYFTRQGERFVFFIMTIIMLIFGLLYKAGIIG